MLISIPDLLSPEQVALFRAQLLAPTAPWVDGLATAGYQGAWVKRNQQLTENSPLASSLGQQVLGALEKHPRFISAALPSRVYPPLFNRYGPGQFFGQHIDNAIRLHPQLGLPFRCDVSSTLFLSEPTSYEGGELLIEDSFGVHAVKLPAGHLVLYPASSLHQVQPITHGERLACFFWTQSLVPDDGKRTVLFDMDSAIQSLAAESTLGATSSAMVQLTGCYHNLLRLWSQTA